MDAAVKRGFVLGFLLVAAGGGALVYGCQPRVDQAAAPGATSPNAPAAETPPTPGSPSDQSGSAPANRALPGVAGAPRAPAKEGAEAGGAPAPAPVDPQKSAAPPALGQAPAGGKAASVDGKQAPPSDAAPGAPAADATPELGTFDVVRVEPSGDMVVAGRCAANCTVELLANGAPHAAATADAAGQWAMTPAPLPPGDYQLSLRTRGQDGEEAVSRQSLTVSVPRPPSKEVVVVLNEPDAPARILQKPAPAVVAGASAEAEAKPDAGAPDTALAIAAVETESGRFYAQGAGPKGARLRLYLNNVPVASATIGGDGRWSLRVDQGLSPGAYTVRADQLDAASARVIARVETAFTYSPEVASTAGATALPSEPQAGGSENAASAANPIVASLDTAQVKRGDSLWRISRSVYGRGMRYTVIYKANDGQIRNPNRIYPGQVLVVPADETESARPAAR